MGFLYKNGINSEIKVFVGIFLVLSLSFLQHSCDVACKYKTNSSFVRGINPETPKKKLVLNKYYYLKNDPWFAWEGRTTLSLYDKVVVEDGWIENDITEDIANEIGRIYSLKIKEKFLKTGFNDLDFTVSQAYSLNENDWLILMGHVCLYQNGKAKMFKEKLFNPKYIGGNFVLNLKKKNEKVFDVYIFNIETGENTPAEEINRGLKDIPELMNTEKKKISSSFRNIYKFVYDVKNKKPYFILTYNVEDFFNHYYLITLNEESWIKEKIVVGDNMGLANLTYFKNDLYVEVRNYQSKEHGGEVGIIKNGKIIYTNKFAGKFIYYKGSLYGTDLQYQNVVKIAE